jgi:lipid-binding SYLF domain-containing protein
MKRFKPAYLLFLLFSFTLTNAQADEYQDTLDIFKNAAGSSDFFKHSHGYAVFPTISKVGFVIGGGGGNGRVYENGKYVGDTTMGQLSIGLQLGAQGFSQIIFFEDKSAFDKFTSGNFEFSADVSAVVITAGASASGGTAGSTAGASGTKDHAAVEGEYVKGMATFVVIKGGLMYEAVLAGQKFEYTPLK